MPTSRPNDAKRVFRYQPSGGPELKLNEGFGLLALVELLDQPNINLSCQRFCTSAALSPKIADLRSKNTSYIHWVAYVIILTGG
jgi:hypothetical protein